MSRARRIGIGVASLVVLQGVIVALYLVKRTGFRQPPSASFPVEQLSSPAPPLLFAHMDGTAGTLTSARGRPVLVHFWATWCEPCRRELPGLLAYADELRKSQPFELIALAVDDDWGEIRTFFGGSVPPAIVRPTDPDAHRQFGASTLPDSYLIDPTGTLIERYHGARDWTTASARTHLANAIAQHGHR